MITINSNTRYFNVPGSDLVFGVVADSDAERKFFQCPRYVGYDLDLAACFIRINYRNANGKDDFYLVDDMVIDGDNITFSWLLSPKVTEYRGQVKFVMCAVGPDLKMKWHTTQGTGQVMEGLEPDNSHVESQTADVVAQLIAMVEAQTSTVEKAGADNVTAVKAATKTAQDSAVTAIETAGAAVKASIPTDYTALGDAMRRVAPGIECSSVGEVITLSDASDNPLRGLRIFGKSTQDGVPTPENPVEIVSVENPVVTVAGKNLFKHSLSKEPSNQTAHSTLISVLSNGIIAKGSEGSDAGSSGFSSGWYFPASDKMLSLKKGDIVTISADYTMVENNYTEIAKISIMLRGQYDHTHAPQISVSVGQKKRVYSTYTVQEDGNYNIVFSLNSGTVRCENIQVEYGGVATEYEPYKEAQSITMHTLNGLPGIPVTSGGNYTDENGQQWICDEVDFERWVYVHRVKQIVLNGSENWRTSSSKYLCLDLEDYAVKGGNGHCSHLVFWFSYSSDCIFATDKWIYLGEMASNRFGLNADTWKAFLSANNVELLYVLATPIETPLSETELAAYRALHTNKPNTTILNDSGAYMSVDYTADTKLYIDKKIKEALQ